ncbi:MAG: hypothetical protein ACK48A_15720, partial [Pseudanabaena sp.]
GRVVFYILAAIRLAILCGYSSVLLLVIVCLDHLSLYIPDFTHFNLHYLNLSRLAKDVLRDEKLRDRFLVKMIYILMVKLSFDGITVIHTIVVTTQYAVIAFSFALPHQLRHR